MQKPRNAAGGSAVTVNGVRNFNITGSTQILLDGQPIPAAQTIFSIRLKSAYSPCWPRKKR